MDIFILELVSNRLTVPVKIDERQEQEENIGAIEQGSMYTHVGHARDYKYSIYYQEKKSEAGWRGVMETCRAQGRRQWSYNKSARGDANTESRARNCSPFRVRMRDSALWAC